MKSYLLLRENTESGPYTKEDLRKKGLQPADLIWIEGESRSWRFPAEIDELKAFIRTTPERQKTNKTASESSAASGVYKVTASTSAPVPALDYSTYLHAASPNDDEKVVFSDFKLQATKKSRFAMVSNLVALLVLAIGVAMTAYVVRSIVVSFGGDTLQSAQASEVQSISYEMENAAYAPVETPVVQSAVLVEAVPVQETQAVSQSAPTPTKSQEKKPIVDVEEILTTEPASQVEIPAVMAIVEETTATPEKTASPDASKADAQKSDVNAEAKPLKADVAPTSTDEPTSSKEKKKKEKKKRDKKSDTTVVDHEI